jgi:Helicase conserved C-terminal domain
MPRIGTHAGDPATIETEASALAGHVLDRAAALLDMAAKAPIAVIKTGGVGQREIKRLGKALSCSEDEIRIIVEAAHEAGLLPFSSTGLVTDGRLAEWMAQPPAVRLRSLIKAWWSTERSPLCPVEGAKPAVLADEPDAEAVLAVRRAALTALVGLRPGHAATDLMDAVRWLCPLYPPDLVAEYLRPALIEAGLLGLVVRGAASGLGRALVGGGDLVAAAQGLATVTRSSALFGADLTAVVTGPPSAELARVLDRVADRESRGTASVWRFSPSSVRRAFDDGVTEDEVIADLAEVARGDLPQPLAYLIKDVGRRHGEVTVAEVVCVVRADDEALLAELAAHRKLGRLGLRLLAPTVLASSAPRDTTLAALRDAGYHPVPVGPDGTSTIRRTTPPRATVRPTHGASDAATFDVATVSSREPGGVIDPGELAVRLRGATGPSEPMSEYDIRAMIAKHTPRLSFSERYRLQHLVQYGYVTRISSTVDGGRTALWTLEKGELDGELLHAWCADANDYKTFRLSAITKVSG